MQYFENDYWMNRPLDCGCEQELGMYVFGIAGRSFCPSCFARVITEAIDDGEIKEVAELLNIEWWTI